jgi:hypothetical protein
MAMIAITTNNSIKVKPTRRWEAGAFPDTWCDLFKQLFMRLSWLPAAGGQIYCTSKQIRCQAGTVRKLALAYHEIRENPAVSFGQLCGEAENQRASGLNLMFFALPNAHLRFCNLLNSSMIHNPGMEDRLKTTRRPRKVENYVIFGFDKAGGAC